MTGRDSRSRVRRAASAWTVPVEAARLEDVDVRLLAGRCGRTGLMQVLIDHDTPAGRCPRCGWAATSGRRDCPSRVIARALLEQSPLPTWLVHLADKVPGARGRDGGLSRETQRAAEDDLPGLFEAPAREPERRR